MLFKTLLFTSILTMNSVPPPFPPPVPSSPFVPLPMSSPSFPPYSPPSPFAPPSPIVPPFPPFAPVVFSQVSARQFSLIGNVYDCYVGDILISSGYNIVKFSINEDHALVTCFVNIPFDYVDLYLSVVYQLDIDSPLEEVYLSKIGTHTYTRENSPAYAQQVGAHYCQPVDILNNHNITDIANSYRNHTMKINFIISNYVGLFCDSKISLYISTENGKLFSIPDTDETETVSNISTGAIIAIVISGVSLFVICIYCADRWLMSFDPSSYKEQTSVGV